MKLLTVIPFLFVSFGLKAQTAKDVARIGINSTVSVVALDNDKQPLGYGSGFILENDLIVTNVHVLEGCQSAYILMNDNKTKYVANYFVSIDKSNDLVILKVTGLVGKSLALASDELPEIGERIYAIGNPKGLSGTFSEGIVSGRREIEDNDLIQITAPISPGSSGGPVLDSKSEVIGIAFASYSDGQNLNFAIPVKYLKILKSLIGIEQKVSTIVPKTKSPVAGTMNPNIEDGVIVRNIEPDENMGRVSFSIKNNLAYTVTDITILILVFDASGTIVDYNESTYFETRYSYSDNVGIRPFLAKTVDFFDSEEEAPTVSLGYGYKVKARVLDFKIVEE